MVPNHKKIQILGIFFKKVCDDKNSCGGQLGYSEGRFCNPEGVLLH